MRSELHVEIEPLVRRDDAVIIGAQVSGHPRRRKRNGKIWIEVPAEMHPWLAVQERPDDLHDAFARMFMLSAMEADRDLVIHGNVSTSLLANLERWQEIGTVWWPTYHKVKLSADREISAAAAPQPETAEAILAFSGGLDSVETLYGHRLGRRGRNTQNITACLFVHGFDVDWRDEKFAAACQRFRRLCEPWGVKLFSVRTNLKELLPNWTMTYAAAVAGMLSLFERRFAAGLIASSRSYRNVDFVISGNGSTALTDPLLSSASFQVIHDLAATRTEKTLLLKDRPEVWPALRVCWEGHDPTVNCGKCEKCIRQMLCMLAMGVDDFSGFESQLSPKTILSVQPKRGVVEKEWRACYALAEKAGRTQLPEFQAMRELLTQCAVNRGELSEEPAESVSSPPAQFSGGLLQRIMGML